MKKIDAINCAIYLDKIGLRFEGSDHELTYYITNNLTDRKLLLLHQDSLRFFGEKYSDTRTIILKECSDYIYDDKDYKDVIKAFLRYEFNIRMNDKENV